MTAKAVSGSARPLDRRVASSVATMRAKPNRTSAGVGLTTRCSAASKFRMRYAKLASAEAASARSKSGTPRACRQARMPRPTAKRPRPPVE